MKLGLITKSLRQNKEKANHHFVFIEAPLEAVFPEIVLWGEALWWPKRVTMKFTRKTPGKVSVGTKYEQRVTFFGGPHWDAEVTKLIPKKEIERTFLNGILVGKESVTLEFRVNGTRVDYLMQYKIRGLLNFVVWVLFFRRLHDRNITMILEALREYILRKQKHPDHL